MNGLNEHHERQLLTTFAYVDRLLSDAVRDLDPGTARSPFSRIVPDAVSVQQQVIADHAAELREHMRAILARYRIALPAREVSAIWSARAAITMAGIALDELDAKRLRGYGALPEEAATEVSAAVAALQELLGRMDAYLVDGTE